MFKLIKENIIPTVKPFYKEGNRQNICIGLAALMAKYNISPQETLEILTPLLDSDPEKDQRIRGIWYTYETYYNGKTIQGYTLLKKIGINVENFSIFESNQETQNNTDDLNSTTSTINSVNIYQNSNTKCCGQCKSDNTLNQHNNISSMLNSLLDLQKYREIIYFIKQLTPNKINDAILKTFDVNTITFEDILFLRKCEIMFEKNLLENIICVVLASTKNNELKTTLNALLTEYTNGSISIPDLYGKIRELKITFCISVTNLNKN